MRKALIICLAAPLLLAPVRMQQGGKDILLTSTPVGQAPGGAAVVLPTPTVIPVEPTVLPASPTQPAPTAPALPQPQPPSQPQPVGPAPAAQAPAPTPRPAPVAPSSPGMSPQQAALCVRSLTLANDLAVVAARQEQSDKSYANLLIATAIAQTQAAQGIWPEISTLKPANLPWFGPLNTELKQAFTYIRNFCTNPNAQPARVTVPRPN